MTAARPTLRGAVEDYLRLRRSLGFALTQQGAMLRDFVGFLDSVGVDTITTAAALAWARQPVNADRTWLHARISVVRHFAVYWRTLDPAAEVPPADLLPDGRHRAIPYIYTRDQINLILQAAGRLTPPLRAASYHTLFGLMIVTGIRVGEAVALDRCDFDQDRSLLTIQRAKFGGSRQLPLHSSTGDALADYARQRDSMGPRARTASLFTSTRGTRIIADNASHVFTGLCRAVGLEQRSSGGRPRLHDLRHTFAVNSFLQWYRSGVDVAPRLPVLSTFMGHNSPSATYWYLTGTPELLALAAERLDRAQQERS